MSELDLHLRGVADVSNKAAGRIHCEGDPAALKFGAGIPDGPRLWIDQNVDQSEHSYGGELAGDKRCFVMLAQDVRHENAGEELAQGEKVEGDLGVHVDGPLLEVRRMRAALTAAVLALLDGVQDQAAGQSRRRDKDR
jgi:hypothetical protein